MGSLIASYGGPAKISTKLHKSPESWNATGELRFLNDWCVLLCPKLVLPIHVVIHQDLQVG